MVRIRLYLRHGTVVTAAALHLGGEGFGADRADTKQAAAPVGAEDEAEEFADQVVQFAAGHRIVASVERALGAALPLVFDAATADRTPCGLLVGSAARTASLAEFAARAAIESAGRDVIRHGCNWAFRW